MEKWYTEKWSSDTKFSIKYNEKILNKKSKFQEIDFYKSDEWGTFFTLDGLMMVTEKDEFIYHDMIVHPAMATNPNIKNILVIGGGDGGTVRELCRYSSIEHIDMVEIDEEVVLLSEKYLPTVSNELRNNKVSLHFTDGIEFVCDAKDESYDLILVDSTDPVGPGESLFTQKFYENCYRILSDDGILINQHESPYLEDYKEQMIKAHGKIKNLFEISKVYQFHQAVYPSGHWLFGFASKKYDPIDDFNEEKWNSLQLKTKYYNTNIHVGSFMLPTYVKEELDKV